MTGAKWERWKSRELGKHREMTTNLVRMSKFISLVLRHNPQQIGLVLDENGWASVEELIARANARGVRLTRDNLQVVVETSDKKRFALSEDGVWLTDHVAGEFLVFPPDTGSYSTPDSSH